MVGVPNCARISSSTYFRTFEQAEAEIDHKLAWMFPQESSKPDTTPKFPPMLYRPTADDLLAMAVQFYNDRFTAGNEPLWVRLANLHLAHAATAAAHRD